MLSVRNVPIDENLAKEILEIGSGRIYKNSPQSIANYIRRQQDKLGMEHFSLHKFRHAFCTMLSEKNIDEATILRLGGWRKNSDVMRRIYRHTNIDRDAEKMNQIRDIFG